MRKIPLNANSFDENEIEAAIRVLRSTFVTMGARCREFETAFAAYLGVREAVFVNSGSSANLLAFFALANPVAPEPAGKRKILPGTEVIVPAVSWSTTFWPIVQVGATPVLVDVDPLTLQIDVQATSAAVTSKTAAICPVHILGNAVPMDGVLSLASQHHLWVIEDTCEALGVRFRGQFVGTLGDVGTFSFFFSHHISTVEGGMLVTNNPELADLLRVMRAHGWTRDLQNRQEVEARYPDIDPAYLFINTGFNLRPTELNGVFGLVQLQKLPEFNRRRQAIAASWNTALQPLFAREIFRPIQYVEHAEAVLFGYPAICRSQEIRDSLKSHLNAHGIETRPIVCGNMARQPALKNVPHRIAGSLAGAEIVMNRGLLWGLHPTLTSDEIQYVADVVWDYARSL